MTQKMTPLEAATELLSYFHWDLDGAINGNFDENKTKQAKAIPTEVLIPVVVALRRFLKGDTDSLDVAFGARTRSKRRKMNRDRERDIIQFLVSEFADQARVSGNKVQGESPKNIGISKTALILGMTESAVEDIYNGER